MSESKTLADVLKCSPEVTSLTNNDRLLAVGADGATKRISEDKLVYPNYRSKDFPSTNTDWVRIASTPEDTPAVATVYFTNGYWAGGPSGLAVVFSTRYENGSWVKPGVRFISGNNPYLLIRTVKIGTSFHLEVKGYSRRLIVCCEGINVFVPDTLETPTIPADATIYTYTSVELSGGGVKRCTSISCGEPQKGGQRDGGSDNHKGMGKLSSFAFLPDKSIATGERKFRRNRNCSRFETATTEVICRSSCREYGRTSDPGLVCDGINHYGHIPTGRTIRVDVLHAGSVRDRFRHSSSPYAIQRKRNGDKVLRHGLERFQTLGGNIFLALGKEVAA